MEVHLRGGGLHKTRAAIRAPGGGRERGVRVWGHVGENWGASGAESGSGKGAGRRGPVGLCEGHGERVTSATGGLSAEPWRGLMSEGGGRCLEGRGREPRQLGVRATVTGRGHKYHLPVSVNIG